MSDGIEPPGQFSGILLFPGLNAHDLTQLPEEEAVQNDVHKDIVALVEFIHELVQPADGVGGFPFFSANLLLYLLEQGGLCRLLFHEVEQGGVGGEDLQFFAIDGLHLGDFASEAEAGDDEAGPDDAVDTCGQESCPQL